MNVRSFGDNNAVRKEKDLHFSVFVQQKWTPYLMMLTLFNSISSLNEFAEETTYRLSGKVELDGQPGVSISTMLAANEAPAPVPNPTGRMVGRQVQSPVPESGADAEAQERGCHHRHSAGAPRSHDRERLDPGERSGSRHGSSGEGFPAALSRRTH